MSRTATTTTTTKKTTTPKTTEPKAPKTAPKTKAATVQVNEVKPSTTTQTKTQTQQTKTNVSWEQRQEMIKVAAYLKAQKRGFTNGNELQDWLDAEREVNKLIA